MNISFTSGNIHSRNSCEFKSPVGGYWVTFRSVSIIHDSPQLINPEYAMYLLDIHILSVIHTGMVVIGTIIAQLASYSGIISRSHQRYNAH